MQAEESSIAKAALPCAESARTMKLAIQLLMEAWHYARDTPQEVSRARQTEPVLQSSSGKPQKST